MQIRFLSLGKQITFLGLDPELTPSEAKLLRAIAENGRMSIDELIKLLNAGVSRGNVAVHINAINRKAERIGGRKLVVFNKDAYEINPLM